MSERLSNVDYSEWEPTLQCVAVENNSGSVQVDIEPVDPHRLAAAIEADPATQAARDGRAYFEASGRDTRTLGQQSLD